MVHIKKYKEKKKFYVRLSSLNIILKKFLKFGKSSLDDSYKKDSYKKKVCNGHLINAKIRENLR